MSMVKRQAYVDVLRGIAILVVIVHHLPEELNGYFGRLSYMGGRGVDLFFVLSGFLIGSTCLARAESSAPRPTQALGYWILRTVRIWPLYFLLLGIFALGPRLVHGDVTFVVRHYPLHYLTFTSNDLGQATLELGILWSLAIEEQFYLAVGILVLACARKREMLAAAFVGMAAAAIAVALRTRYELHTLHAGGMLNDTWYVFKLYHSTLSRIDQLALGIICAVVAPSFNASRWARQTRWSRLTTWLGLAAVAVVLVVFPQIKVVEFFILGALFAVGILWAQRPGARNGSAHSAERLPLAILANAGKLSFGLYMIHPVSRFWMNSLFGRWHVPPSALAAVLFLTGWLAISWVLAYASYHLLEEPLLDRARSRVSAMIAGKASVFAKPQAAA